MTLTVEHNGPVTTIVRSRIAARNAMDPASAEALTDALLAFDADPAQSVAVLWGAGGAFCAGFDLKYAATMLGREKPMAALEFPAGDGPVPRGPMGPRVIRQLEKIPFWSILARISGVAAPAIFHILEECSTSETR